MDYLIFLISFCGSVFGLHSTPSAVLSDQTIDRNATFQRVEPNYRAPDTHDLVDKPL